MSFGCHHFYIRYKIKNKVKSAKYCLIIWLKAEDLVQFSHSVVSDSLWDPVDCSMPGYPVHHQPPKSTQTHVHWVSDAIQPSHPLSSPSPALNLSQHQGLFQWVSSPIGGQRFGVSASASILPMNIQDRFPLGLTGWISLKSKGSFPTPQFKSINSSVFRFLCGPTQTSIHDYWKNYSFD